MIEFVTLYLGLVMGLQPVEVTVGAQVASVEVLLDSASIGIIQRAPWRIDCDFGPRLLPHKLEAVARDRDGVEVGRAEQWLNLPRKRAEAKLSLYTDETDGSDRIRLIWEALDSASPKGVRVLLDGDPLPMTSLDKIELPATDPGSFHVLTAELEFADGLSATAEVVFGGTFGDSISSDLTAVVLRTDRSRLPRVSELAGRLLIRGSPLRVIAVERPPIEIVVVREQTDGLFGALQRLVVMGGSQRVPLRTMLPEMLRPIDRVRFVLTTPNSRNATPGTYELMPVTGDLTGPDDLSLFELLTDVDSTGRNSLGRQQLADAVAVGGLVASASNRRRAVLLLTSGDSTEVSRLAPELARGYLDSLMVPLVVWRLRPPAGEKPSPSRRWGASTEVTRWGGFSKANRRIEDLLESQFLVWVEGRHLRHEITLAQGDDGLTLARSDSPELAAEIERLVQLGKIPQPQLPIDSGTSAPLPTEIGPPLTVIDSERLATARQFLGDDATSVPLGPVTLITNHTAPRLWKDLERLSFELPRLYTQHYGIEVNLDAGAIVALFDTEDSYRAFEAEIGVAAGQLLGHASAGLAAIYAGSRSNSEIAGTFTHELSHLLNLDALGVLSQDIVQ